MNENPGCILSPPRFVAWTAYALFRTDGEWPSPRRLHLALAEELGYPLEHAEHDTLMALNAGAVYGLPTVVGMRLGEVRGYWRTLSPLPDKDNGFRIAMRQDCVHLAADVWETPKGCTDLFRALENAA